MAQRMHFLPIKTSLRKSLCSNTHPTQPPKLQSIVTDQERNDKIKLLQTHLHNHNTNNAKKLLKHLILSKSPFSSPSQMYSMFTHHSHSIKFTFSNLLLSVCVECKLPNEALECYTLVRNDGVFPALWAFNLMLECLVGACKYDTVLENFDQVVELGVKVDAFSYGKAVQSAVKMGDLKRGLDLMEGMKRDGMSVGGFFYNVLISGLCKERRIKDARKLFDEMSEKVLREMESYGFVPDGYTYSIIFDGHSRSGNVNASVHLYEETVRKGIKINEYTCSVLLNTLCKCGKMDEVEEILEK
ncbi:hypothetical protein POM88_046650 [Heracleum sosnowskyi]|uniref:Pentatricopeptide repeat-containing protein n=1 Tax=Heracleum sosnowskyi TaxID=360622 RepID=A0AAD8M682_9APIA|nr:hypothetical protein POM88_046650 [Heracleum sosnowskyi]